MAAAMAYGAAIGPALARCSPNYDRPWNGPNAVAVPEIDGSAGLLAVAAVAAALLLIWERKRQAKA